MVLQLHEGWIWNFSTKSSFLNIELKKKKKKKEKINEGKGELINKLDDMAKNTRSRRRALFLGADDT